MAKPRGLGRGLSALIPDKMGDASSAGSPSPEGWSREVAVDLIDRNPFQPRRDFAEDEMAQLVESVRIHGVIQPVVLRAVGGRFQLVAGERRVRAARMAGLRSVPAVVRELSDRDAMEIALVENLQRADLNPIEESQAYARLIDEFGWTQEEIGARVGKSRSHVANYLRLLQLESSIQELLRRELISVAHAKVLLSIDGPRRVELAERCGQEGWTVKQLEGWAKRPEVPPPPTAKSDDVHLRALEAGLRRRLGTRVTLRGDANKGRIEIPYRSLEELERLLSLLDSPGPDDHGPFVV